MKINQIVLFSFCSVLLLACSEPFPRPKGYMRIALPETSYVPIEHCYFRSVISEAAVYKPITRKGSDCWFNIAYPSIKGEIHFTYHKIEDNLGDLIKFSHSVKDKHNQVASHIPETLFSNPEEKVGGLIFEIRGKQAASPINFFVTDSTRHFLMGSLYFNHSPNNDSIQPSIDYIKSDIKMLIDSLTWNN